jgi:hypothetical protein
LDQPWSGEVELLGEKPGPRPAMLITSEDVQALLSGEKKEHRRHGQLNSEREMRVLRCLKPER